MSDLSKLAAAIKTEAYRLGFDPVGIAPALPTPHFNAFVDWIEAGHQAGMHYLAREDTLAKRADPRLILEGCQRVICLALPYQPPQRKLGDVPPGQGRISAYATIPDYHDVIQTKLSRLERFIQNNTDEDVRTKSYVDTGPILERSFASQAGLGMTGKNSCLIIQGHGSYFFLSEILINLTLPMDAPFIKDLCGSCRRCIDACPTACILPNRMIDAGRCISYLTIENKGSIPEDLKDKIGSWLFGCDICQMVCPHNTLAANHSGKMTAPMLPERLDLLGLFAYDAQDFADHFGKTALSRAKRRGLLRNAAIVLGNQAYKPAIPILKNALTQEEDPIIRDACRWAIDKIENAD